VSGVADRRAAAAKYHVIPSPDLFGRERSVMRPFAREIAAGDFAGRSLHRHQSLDRHILNSVSSRASTSLNQTAYTRSI
jgi:hypothetical protein